MNIQSISMGSKGKKGKKNRREKNKGLTPGLEVPRSGADEVHSQHSDSTGTKEKEENEDYVPSLPSSSGCRPKCPPVERTEAKMSGTSEKYEAESLLQKTTTICEKSGYAFAPSTLPSNAQGANRDAQPEKSSEMTPSESLHPGPPDFKFPSAKPGTAGSPISLITNYYYLRCELRYVYHYDIDIHEVKRCKSDTSPATCKGKPKPDHLTRVEKQQQANVSRKFCREALDKFLKLLKENKRMTKLEPIYDGGRNLFTSQKLPIQDQLSFDVPLEVGGRTKLFTVSLKPVKKLDGTNVINMDSLQNVNSFNCSAGNEVLLVLNAIMTHRDSDSSEIRVGRSYFSTRISNRINVGEGLEIWRGFSQSVHPTAKGPAIVLNLSARVFHKAGKAIDYISELLGRDITPRNAPLKPYELTKIKKALGNVRVKVTHLNYPRQYRIKDVTDLSAADLKMQIDSTEKSIAQYFREKYGDLKFPHLNCFQMHSQNNKTFIPFELCSILPDQPKAGKIDDLSRRIATEMINKTAITPAERFRDINKYAEEVSDTCAPQMKEFQLFMDLTPKKVRGRVLDAPELKYSGGSCFPRNGTWSIQMKKFIKAKRFQSWILVNFTRSESMLEQFARDLSNVFHRLGLFFEEFKGIKTYASHIPTEKILNSPEVRNSSLVVIVLSKRENSRNYDEIKFIADYGLGIVTQCILDSVLSRNDPKILSNICLKINTKLGGVNHELAKTPVVLEEPAIILGIDVVHSTLSPSIAAVVGSMDPYVSAYKVCCRVQENEKRGKKSQEIILELEKMVEILLKGFLEHNGENHPRKILCFRDGVSEGQFREVAYHEVNSIKRASQNVLGEVIPLTFMVVQKRHQTRLRTENPKDGVGRGSNIPAGTKVDTDITYPDAFDFFLCSHEGIRGTSKPTRYTVLHDENNFDADTLHKFTYDLCHLYSRCTKSVSIPAPVKYADLAAYRAKKYADFQLRKMRKPKTSSSLSYSGRSSDLPQYARVAINNMEASKHPMFFI